MGNLVPRDLRRNRVSTAVWLASKRRDKLRERFINGTTPPFGALAYYDYTQENPENVIKELVKKQVSLITERDSNAHILQSANNTIETFTVGEPAFNRGSGLVIEPLGVNKLVNNKLEGTGGAQSAPDLWTGFALGGTRTPQPSILTPNATAIRFTANNERPIISQFLDLPVGKHTYSCLVEEVHVGTLAVGVMSISSGTATQTVSYPKCEANPLGGSGATILNTGRLLISVDVTVAGTLSARIGVGTNTTATGDLTLSMPQFEAGEYATSVILTESAAAQREASNEQISTFLEAQRWIDNSSTSTVPMTAGTYNQSGWTNGAASTGVIFIEEAGNGINGKYPALTNSNWIGGKLSTEDGSTWAYITSTVNDDAFFNSIRFTEVHGGTWHDFQYPAKLNFDFTTSAYLTNGSTNLAADTLVVDALRTSAGDNVSSLPAAEMWPLDNFELFFDLIFNGETDAFPRLFYCENDAGTEGLQAFKLASDSNMVSARITIGNVDYSADSFLTSDVEVGDRLQITMRVESPTMSATIVNVTNGETASDSVAIPSGLVGWFNNIQLSKTAGLSNGVISEFIESRLTSI
jgi:hypothetical protein